MRLQLLLEDLGNLKFINSKFFNFLKTVPYGSTKKVGLPNNFGERSEVIAEKDINKVKITGIVEEEDFIVGILQSVNNQLAMIKRYDGNEYEIVVDIRLLESALDREEEEKLYDMELESNLLFFNLDDDYLQTKKISVNRIDKQLRILLDAIKLYSDKVDFVYAVADVNRKDLGDFRRVRKKIGSDKNIKIFPARVPGSNELTFEKDSFYLGYAKSLLKMRLENYKISNATNIDSVDKLLDIVKYEGIKDVIKVKGFTYKLKSMSNFDIRTLKGEEDRTKSYIVYELYQDDQVKKISETIAHFNEVYGDNRSKWPESVTKHYNAIKPPIYIKVEMKFRFGQIVPVNVIGSDSSF